MQCAPEYKKPICNLQPAFRAREYLLISKNKTLKMLVSYNQKRNDNFHNLVNYCTKLLQTYSIYAVSKIAIV